LNINNNRRRKKRKKIFYLTNQYFNQIKSRLSSINEKNKK
jgi:hypothetical protein